MSRCSVGRREHGATIDSVRDELNGVDMVWLSQCWWVATTNNDLREPGADHNHGIVQLQQSHAAGGLRHDPGTGRDLPLYGWVTAT